MPKPSEPFMPQPRALPGYKIEPHPDGLVLVSNRDGARHYLNRTAALIYASCDGRASAEEIARTMAGQFGLDDPPLDEVLDTLTDLARRGLIDQPGSPPSDGG
jgi:hypothetical protein